MRRPRPLQSARNGSRDRHVEKGFQLGTEIAVDCLPVGSPNFSRWGIARVFEFNAAASCDNRRGARFLLPGTTASAEKPSAKGRMVPVENRREIPVSFYCFARSVFGQQFMSSASLSPLTSLLKIECHLAAAEQVLMQDVARFPVLHRIQDLVSEALQCVTTERLRLKYGLQAGREGRELET